MSTEVLVEKGISFGDGTFDISAALVGAWTDDAVPFSFRPDLAVVSFWDTVSTCSSAMMVSTGVICAVSPVRGVDSVPVVGADGSLAVDGAESVSLDAVAGFVALGAFLSTVLADLAAITGC
jgi:hypothetical protein